MGQQGLILKLKILFLFLLLQGSRLTDGSGSHHLYDAVLDDQGGEGLRANLGAEGAGLLGLHKH